MGQETDRLPLRKPPAPEYFNARRLLLLCLSPTSSLVLFFSLLSSTHTSRHNILFSIFAIPHIVVSAT